MGLGRVIGRAIGKKIAKNYEEGTAEVDLAISTLDEKQKKQYEVRYQINKKKILIGYLFLFLYGSHYAYTGKWVKQVIFWMTLGGFFIWWFLDLFLMFFVVDTYNRKLSLELIRKIRAFPTAQSKNSKSDPTTELKRPAVLLAR